MIKKLKTYTLCLVFLSSLFLCAAEPNSVIATITVGDTPSAVAVTPNNLYAYVTNNNNDSILNGDTVSVLNLTYNTLETTISDMSFSGPYTVTINASGTKAYVTNSNSTTVSIIDLATNTVTGIISGFSGPTGFAITPDGTTAYVNNYGYGGGSGSGTTVNVVDLNTNMIVGESLTVGQAPAALAITPDGAYVYVVSYVDGTIDGGTISIIDTSDNSVNLNAITGLSGPFAIAITPNGEYAYVTNFGSNNFIPVGTTVSVIDISTNTIVDTITLGLQPAGIAITPDGSTAYVSNYSTVYQNADSNPPLISSQGTINSIDINTNSVTSQIIGGIGLAPGGITISPNGQFAYVTNYGSNTVSIIALPTTFYNINRLRPHYNLQQDETITKLTESAL